MNNESQSVYTHERYELIMSDGYSIYRLGIFESAEDAQKAMENDYAEKNENDEESEWTEASEISEGEAILYNQGVDVYTYKIFKTVHTITKAELQSFMSI